MKEADQRYLDGVLRKIEERDPGLSDAEAALGRKYQEIQQGTAKLAGQANALEKEIQIKNGQLENLKDQIKREFGRGVGILDSLLALRPQPERSAGNGEASPEPPQEIGREADA